MAITAPGGAAAHASLSEADLRAIGRDPDFAALARGRARLGAVVVGLMVAVYFGYILLLAFAPGTMRLRVTGQVTLGFPLGLGVLVVTFLLVALYVARSGTRLDALAAGVVARNARPATIAGARAR